MRLFWITTIVFVLFLVVFRFSAQRNHDLNPSSITIGFMGDVMIGRLVNDVIKEKGYRYPWGNMLEVVSAVNLSILNLETTLTRSEKKLPKVFNFKSEPDHVAVLQAAGIDIVNLANNHSLDFDKEGLRETVHVLEKANIHHVGAGLNIEEAQKPVIIEKNGIKIGVIGFTDNEPDWLATENRAGTNYIEIDDIEVAQKVITSVRDRVDVLIVSIHWGPNMKDHPSKKFIDFAHNLIDLGVDIIHGHSAHVVQGIEIYKGKLIMYDTGDFIDDYMVNQELRNDLSFFFQIEVNKKGIQTVTLIPIQIENMQAKKATGKDRQLIVDLMKRRSRIFGTTLIESNQELMIRP